ncbi:MAG: phosphate ABC transporter permease subunit PstC [Chloroflexi bacterium]|nr:phosphate ABC transporter permease subunit PstC [Chloroflexota bacterium]
MRSARLPVRRRVARLGDRIAEGLVFLAGGAAVLFVALILIFLLREGLPLVRYYSPIPFLTGAEWYPLSGVFGILPLVLGSLLVTAGAVAIALPLGLAVAIYLAEVAPAWIKDVLKPTIELLAGIPSVLLGFVGYAVVATVVKNVFGLPTGLTALTGSIMLAYMALPTIISIADDAIRAVPDDFRHASYALGATRWQTIRAVTVPAAASGILAAIMLGIGRAIGETMTVWMVTGNAAVIPTTILQPVRTMTATIAAEMGETARGSDHYAALFAVGIVLFVMTALINTGADLVLHRMKKKYE